jgi:ABC-type glycerol-3-phosphate transport system substrate-binding protein
MKLARRIRPIVASGLLAAAVVAGTATTASASGGMPGGGGDCRVGLYGEPGEVTFTVHITINPCHFPVRGYADCFSEFIPPYGWRVHGTSRTTVPADSEVNCVPGSISNFYGYQVYENGHWDEYPMD